MCSVCPIDSVFLSICFDLRPPQWGESLFEGVFLILMHLYLHEIFFQHVFVAIKSYVKSTLTGSPFDRFIDCTISNRKGWTSAHEGYFLYWQNLMQKENWHDSCWFLQTLTSALTFIFPSSQLTWVLTQRWSLIFSYFELKKSWGTPRDGTQVNYRMCLRLMPWY